MAQVLEKVNLREIRKTLSHIYHDINIIEIKLNSIEKMNGISSEEQFKRKYPNSKVRKELFDLVGILPNISIENDKREIALSMDKKIS